MSNREEADIHLRMLTADDAPWVAELDADASTDLTSGVGFDAEGLADELDAGAWATDDQWGWAVMVDGAPAGFALVTEMTSGTGEMQIRLREGSRGRGVGRETLRQLADHHFADVDGLTRLVGRTHERNVPMQRAFNAAGFQLDTREHGALEDADGRPVARWSYQLTRDEWRDNRHRRDARLDVNGLVFGLEEILDGPTGGGPGLTFTFWQQDRKVWATFGSQKVNEGELGGVLLHDVLHYQYVQDHHRRGVGIETVTGHGRARFQFDTEGRMQVINEWFADDGTTGSSLLVQTEVER